MEILTCAEVATLLKLHLKTVYKLVEDGTIPGTRIGRSWRFDRGEIEALLKKGVVNGNDR